LTPDKGIKLHIPIIVYMVDLGDSAV